VGSKSEKFSLIIILSREESREFKLVLPRLRKTADGSTRVTIIF